LLYFNYTRLQGLRKDEIQSFFHLIVHILKQIVAAREDDGMTWKKALYSYVNAKNQADIEGSIDPLVSVIDDSIYINDQHARLRRTASIHQDRGLKPLRGETRLKLTGVQETEGQITANIELHRTFRYGIKHIEHTEERIELERVTLWFHQGKWRVRGCETRLSEKNESSPKHDVFSHISEQALSDSYRMPSIPYINYSILNKEETLPRGTRYDRARVVQYAETWWSRPNPKYLEFAVDCTNYVSQCLYAGGAPMHYTGKRGSGWWYAGKQGSTELWSFSWAMAHNLQTFVSSSRRGLRGTVVSSAQQLQPGDMISYDWDGDGRFQHNTIVIGLDANGAPLVNAHTYNSRGRYWDYRDSPAWSERTRYVFVRIADIM
jgi:hypothetical protein